MHSIRQTVGINLRFYRKKNGYTQEELAEHVKVDSGYISRVELGKVNISVDYVARICKVLKILPAQLFEE